MRAPVLAGLLLTGLLPGRLPAHAGLAEDLANLEVRIAANPDDGALRRQRSERLLLAGRPRAALADAWLASPPCVRAGLVAASLAALDRWNDAAPWIDRRLGCAPEDLDARLLRARWHLHQGRPAAALPDLHVVAEARGRPDDWLRLARTARAAAAPEAAVDAYIAGLAATGADVLRAELTGYLLELGRREEAHAHARKLVDRAPNHPGWRALFEQSRP